MKSNKDWSDINNYGSRSGVLQFGRYALSVDAFEKYNKTELFLMQQSDFIKHYGLGDWGTLILSTDTLIKRLIGERSIGERTRNQIHDLTKIYYAFGKFMSTFYIGFANDLHEYFLSLKSQHSDIQMIFDGRDSLAFFTVYSKIYSNDAIFSRSNRGSVMSYMDGSILDNYIDSRNEENQNIIDFYKRNNLIGKPLLFVDSGFNATLPRLHQMVLKNNHIDVFKIYNYLAFYYDDHQTINEIVENNFAQDPEIVAVDDTNKSNIKGYVNELFEIDSTSMKRNDPLWKIIQELGSYIKEARVDGLQSYTMRTKDGNFTDYTLGSIQELIAKYNFMKGLIDSDMKNTPSKELITQTIDIFKGFILSYPNIFGDLSDIEERKLDNKNVKDICDLIYTILKQNNLRLAIG